LRAAIALAIVVELVEEISGDDEFEELADDVVDVDVTSLAGKAPEETATNLLTTLVEPVPVNTGFRATIFLPPGPVTTMI
jgi:hypothetical protein